MARLFVGSNAGCPWTEIVEDDHGYRWTCTCGHSGRTRRRVDAIEDAGIHVDRDHLDRDQPAPPLTTTV